MINSEDLRAAIKQNLDIINRFSGSVSDRNDLYHGLQYLWREKEARQLYWNILCLMAIETNGFVEFNHKVSYEAKLVINSESIHMPIENFSSDLFEIKTLLRDKGILPEIINKLDIRIS